MIMRIIALTAILGVTAFLAGCVRGYPAYSAYNYGGYDGYVAPAVSPYGMSAPVVVPGPVFMGGRGYGPGFRGYGGERGVFGEHGYRRHDDR